jgi:hypothetical protein
MADQFAVILQTVAIKVAPPTQWKWSSDGEANQWRDICLTTYGVMLLFADSEANPLQEI